MAASMAAAPLGAGNTGLLAPSQDGGAVLAEVEALGARIARVRAAIGRVIFGQDEVIDQTLITLLSGGHVLLVGVPGLGKSRLVETLGVVLGLATKRVQFTPDLMPADIVGSEVLDEAEGRRSFRFLPGPVFCQLLMAERTMLLATTGTAEAPPSQAMTAAELLAAQALIRRVPVGEKVVDAILSLVRGGRPETAEDDTVRRHVAWGPGPRAAQALMLASRARALLGGRLAPSIDDVVALARPVLRHRMALSFSARADGVVLGDVIDRLVARLG